MFVLENKAEHYYNLMVEKGYQPNTNDMLELVNDINQFKAEIALLSAKMQKHVENTAVDDRDTYFKGGSNG